MRLDVDDVNQPFSKPHQLLAVVRNLSGETAPQKRSKTPRSVGLMAVDCTPNPNCRKIPITLLDRTTTQFHASEPSGRMMKSPVGGLYALHPPSSTATIKRMSPPFLLSQNA